MKKQKVWKDLYGVWARINNNNQKLLSRESPGPDDFTDRVYQTVEELTLTLFQPPLKNCQSIFL
jgi:hypothetical protein